MHGPMLYSSQDYDMITHSTIKHARINGYYRRHIQSQQQHNLQSDLNNIIFKEQR